MLVEVRQGTVVIAGHANNAAKLSRAIEQMPEFGATQFLTPTTRQPDSDMEQFVLQFQLIENGAAAGLSAEGAE